MKQPGAIHGILIALAIVLGPRPGLADDARAQRHYDQGKAYFHVQAFDKAIDEFETAYRLSPDSRLLFNIALAYVELGDKPSALRYYQKYLEVDPQGRGATEARARVVALERDIARDAAAKARADAIAAHLREARAHRAEGRISEAVVAYQETYEIDRNPDILFEIAETLRAASQRDEAIAYYQSYLAEAPSGPHHPAARKHLRTLEHQAITVPRAPGPAEPTPDLTPKAPASGPEPAVSLQPPPVPQPAVRDDGGSGKRRWLWIGAAAAAVAGGVLLDNAPESAHNGAFDPLDLAPVGLYGLGATAFLVGVF